MLRLDRLGTQIKKDEMGWTFSTREGEVRLGEYMAWWRNLKE